MLPRILRTVSSMWPLATARSSAPSRSTSRKAQPNPKLFFEGKPTPAATETSSKVPACSRRYKPIISLSKFVIATPDFPERSKSPGVHAHSRAGFAVAAEGQPGFHRDIFEFSVVQIAIEFVGLRIVGHQQVRPAVLIVIKHRHAERFRAAVENPAAGGDILKRSVAAIVKQPASIAAIGFRRAIRFVHAIQAAENIVLRRPAHVVADE